MHRMNLHEVGEVARRAAASGARVHGGGPTVHKVADALGLPPTEVEILLDQSRQGGSAVRDFKVVLAVAALVFAFMLGVGTTSLLGRREVPPTVASAPIASPTSSEISARPPTMSAGEPIRTASSVVPNTTNEESPQLTGQLGTLEAKTSSSDARRAVEEVRRSTPPFAQNNPPNGPVQTMSAASISR